jgi:hypothetical protein
LRYEPHVERNEFGTKRCGLHVLSRAGHHAARSALLHQLRHFADADFRDMVKRVREKHSKFLMVGHRWDIDIAAPLSFENKDWEPLLRWRVFQKGAAAWA